MELATWPDGFRLVRESRIQDPLYYYVRADGWAHAIGFEVEPLYEDEVATDVKVSVFGPHRARLPAESPFGPLVRVVVALIHVRSNWRRLSVAAEDVADPQALKMLLPQLLDVGFKMDEEPSETRRDWVTFTRD